MESASVHLATPEDSRAIWEIRYTPEINATALNQTGAQFEQHDAWFQKKYFSGLPNYCFVLKNQTSQVVGYCRFDCGEQARQIVSIALLPAAQGKGWGKKLLDEAISNLTPPTILEAVIKKENSASMVLFQKVGFSIDRTDAENNYLSKKV